MKQLIKTMTTIALTLFVSTTWAASVTIPNEFSSGQPAVAADVNANFTAVKTAVDDNDSNITTNTTAIGTNATAITAAQGSATSAATSIQANEAAIDNLQSSATAVINLVNQIAVYEDGNIINIDDIIEFVEGDSFIRHLVGGEEFMQDTTILAGNRFYRVTEGFNTPNSPAVITDLSPYASKLQAITLSGSGGSGSSSTADNSIITVNCSTQSLQAAIETAPLHGKVIIQISGTCTDDIFVRRSGITIQGDTNDAANSVITGNATGFSSASSENYQYTENNPVGLVQRPPSGANKVSAAIDISDRRVTLKNLTINAGLNSHALRVGNGSRIKLVNVVLNGRNYGMRVSNNSSVVLTNTTINTDGTVGIDGSGNGTCNNPFCGSGIFASVNSSIILKSGNTISPAANADGGYALAAINGVAISLRGANNDIESLSIIGSNFEQTRFENGGTGNQIRGDLRVCGGSSFIAQQISINAGSGESNIEVCGQSTMLLGPRSANAISVTTENIDIKASSTLIIEDDDNANPFAISFAHPSSEKIEIEIEAQSSFVNENGGTMPANFDVGESSSLGLDNGTIINGNVDIYQGSSFFSKADSDIDGDLVIDGFSTYLAVEQGNSVAAGDANQSVSGTVVCSNAEAIETQGDDSGATNNLCSTTE